MLPLVPLFAGGAYALSGIYNVGKAIDTRNYWRSYYANTGFRPRYPYRAGVYDWMKNDIFFFNTSKGYWR